MPQMSPMNWTTLSTMMIMNIIYLSITTKQKMNNMSKSKMKLTTNKKTWNW